MKKPKVTIVILSYNTKDILKNCLNSIKKHTKNISYETIVVDNNSSDGSPQMIKKDFKWVKLIQNKKNLGFAKGNNKARKIAKGEYVLFLNSDTEFVNNALKNTYRYTTKNNIKAITIKQVLPSGELDKDSRRSFPTPFIAFTHFSGLDRVFPKSKLLSKYWYGYVSEDKVHKIDVAQGAFFMIEKKLLDSVGWFSEEYFLDGEDIDLSYKIHLENEDIVYYPKAKILHLKKASKKASKEKKNISQGVDSMKIFYKKYLSKNYNFLVNKAVYLGISLIKIKRNVLH